MTVEPLSEFAYVVIFTTPRRYYNLRSNNQNIMIWTAILATQLGSSFDWSKKQLF